MKKGLIKKLTGLALALVMAFAMVGCGDSAAPKAMSEADYTAKVAQVYGDIEKAGVDAMADVDSNDPAAVMKATVALAKKVKPMYQELGSFQAPHKYKEAQTKLKSGAEASAKLMDLSVTMMEKSTDPKAASDEKMMAELTKMAEEMAPLATQAQDLLTGLQLIKEASAK